MLEQIDMVVLFPQFYKDVLDVGELAKLGEYAHIKCTVCNVRGDISCF